MSQNVGYLILSSVCIIDPCLRFVLKSLIQRVDFYPAGSCKLTIQKNTRFLHFGKTVRTLSLKIHEEYSSSSYCTV